MSDVIRQCSTLSLKLNYVLCIVRELFIYVLSNYCVNLIKFIGLEVSPVE